MTWTALAFILFPAVAGLLEFSYTYGFGLCDKAEGKRRAGRVVQGAYVVSATLALFAAYHNLFR